MSFYHERVSFDSRRQITCKNSARTNSSSRHSRIADEQTEAARPEQGRATLKGVREAAAKIEIGKVPVSDRPALPGSWTQPS